MNDSDSPRNPRTANSGSRQNHSSLPSDRNRSRNSKGNPAPRKGWLYFRWTLGILFCTFTMTAGTILGNFYLNNSTIRNIINTGIKHPGMLIKAGGDITQLYTPKIQLPDKDVVTLLILGCDVDYENSRPVEVKNSRGRSDSIMIARMDFKNNHIDLLSIPRDTAVRIPGYGIQKINAANAIGGHELAQSTIKDVFGIDTDYYLVLNYDGFKKVVDKLDGVNLTVHKKMDYDDNWGNLHVHLRPGAQHLTGTQAMGYVRFRHSDSDFMRAERQHEFIQAVKERVKSPSAFNSLPGAITAITESIASNLTEDQELALMNFARQVPPENMQVATMPSYEGPSYVYCNVPKTREMIQRIFYKDSGAPSIVNVVERGEIVARAGRGKRSRHRRQAAVDPNLPQVENLDSSTSDSPTSIIDGETSTTDGPAPPASDSSSNTSDKKSTDSEKNSSSGKSSDEKKTNSDSSPDKSSSGDKTSGTDSTPK